MQRRAVRLTILTLLVAAGLCASYFTWDIYLRLDAALDAERAADERLDRMSAAVASLGAAQQAYVAPGQQRGDALTRATLLIQELYDDTAALRRTTRSDGAAPSALIFGETVDALVKIDDRAREHLRNGEELMAADLVYTEARQVIDTLTDRLKGLRLSERTSAAGERNALQQRALMILAGVASIWIAGLLSLVRSPARMELPAVVASDPPAIVESPAATPEPARVDLAAAARICGELSRLQGGSGLAPVLARTARVLDASGLVIWLGAGEELFAATAHGYTPRTLARLGPVPRSGDNATAAAWRTAEMQTVPGCEGSNGAIVAPLSGADGCFGVLAAEVRGGREHDNDTRAVTAIIAAQLAAIVAPWPAPSYADVPSPGVEERQTPSKAASA
jgi:hypothetical protein